MEQFKRGIAVGYLSACLILIIFSSCRTRKVSSDIEKFSDKTRTEQKDVVKEETKTTIKDKSKTTVTETDSTKTITDEQEEITADEVIKGKDGTTHFKGHVSYKGKKQVNTQAQKDKVTESLKDVSTDISTAKDSTGSKKVALDQKSYEKKKDTSVESISWLTIAVPLLIALVIAILAVKWSALTGFWRGLFR